MKRMFQAEDLSLPRTTPILDAARDGWGTTARYAVLLFIGRVLPSVLATGVLLTARNWLL